MIGVSHLLEEQRYFVEKIYKTSAYYKDREKGGNNFSKKTPVVKEESFQKVLDKCMKKVYN